jgi:hypothetical protein
MPDGTRTAIDVVNPETVGIFCDELAAGAELPETKRWIKRNLRKHVLRTGCACLRLLDPDDVEATPGSSVDELRSRTAKALSEGRAPLQFDPLSVERETNFPRLAAEIRDWLDGGGDDADPLSAPSGDRVARVSFADAERRSLEWHERISQKAAIAFPEDPSGIVERKRFPDGDAFFLLKSAAALRREGAAMAHCVGSYADRVLSGKSEIHSLRDAGGIPHVTMEIRNGRLIQIRGTANSTVSAKWREKTVLYILENGWKVGAEGRTIGLIELGGRVWRGLEQAENALSSDERDAGLADDYLAALVRERREAPERLVDALRRRGTERLEAIASPKEAIVFAESLRKVGVPLRIDDARKLMRSVLGKTEIGSAPPAEAAAPLGLFGLRQAILSVPTTPIRLVERGIVPDELVEEAMELMRPGIERALEILEKKPEVVWIAHAPNVAWAAAKDAGNEIRRIAAFCGLGARMESAANKARETKKSMVESKSEQARRTLRTAPIDSPAKIDALKLLRVRRPLALSALETRSIDGSDFL